MHGTAGVGRSGWQAAVVWLERARGRGVHEKARDLCVQVGRGRRSAGMFCRAPSLWLLRRGGRRLHVNPLEPCACDLTPVLYPFLASVPYPCPLKRTNPVVALTSLLSPAPFRIFLAPRPFPACYCSRGTARRHGSSTVGAAHGGEPGLCGQDGGEPEGGDERTARHAAGQHGVPDEAPAVHANGHDPRAPQLAGRLLPYGILCVRCCAMRPRGRALTNPAHLLSFFRFLLPPRQ